MASNNDKEIIPMGKAILIIVSVIFVIVAGVVGLVMFAYLKSDELVGITSNKMPDIVGKWIVDNGLNGTLYQSITFFEDNKYEYYYNNNVFNDSGIDEGTYTIEKDKIVCISSQKDKASNEFKIKGGIIYLGEYPCYKEESSIINKSSVSDSKIVGEWIYESDYETRQVSFSADGKFSVYVKTYLDKFGSTTAGEYTVNSDTITLMGSDGSKAYSLFEIENDTLRIELNGEWGPTFQKIK